MRDMLRRWWQRPSRARYRETCAHIASNFGVYEDTPDGLDALIGAVWMCKTESDELERQLTRAEDKTIEQHVLRAQLRQLIHDWNDQIPLLDTREDRGYRQACRDHAAELEALLPPVD